MMAKFHMCVALLVVLENVLAITVEQKSQIQTKFLQVGVQCIKDHPMSIVDLAALKNRKLPDGENTGCFMACIFKNVGLLDDGGKLSAANAKEHAKQVFSDEDDIKNFDEFIATCDKVNEEEVSDGDKGCDRAKLVFTCLNDQSSKFGFKIEF